MPLASPDAISVPQADQRVSKPIVPEAPKLKGKLEAEIVDIIESKASDPDSALAEIARGQESHSLIVDLSPENVARAARLRDPELVGKNAYGKGAINFDLTEGQDLQGKEAVQRAAYETELPKKIDAGLVDPFMIGTDICLKLDVSPDVENIPANYDQIPAVVSQELQKFLQEGHLNQQEHEAIVKELEEFSNLYGEAYGKDNIAKAYEVVRDNARKLAYQSAVDKNVFVGSDHGTRHIIDGNIKFAKQLLQSLREKGVNVSAKDEVAIHQTMIDHDLGYAVGSAQAPEGFAATSDHPLIGAKFVEVNKAYYVDKFGEDGYNAIHYSILNHSYPRLEYQSDAQNGVHEGLVRSITSTVDALGVTVETKTPEFFWNKDAMRTLLKIRLATDTIGMKPELMAQYKDELRATAGKEQNPDRRQAYENAVSNFFSQFTGDNTLGHFTGVVRNVSVEKVAYDTDTEINQEHGHGDEDSHGETQGKLRVVVEMTPTEVYALLGNMFGDKLAARSFVKAVKDLGLNPDQIEKHARVLRGSKARGEEQKGLEVVSNHARVIVGNQFLEDQPTTEIGDVDMYQKIQAIAEVFHEAELLSARTEINALLEEVDERGDAVMPEIRAKFIRGVAEKTTADEINKLNDLISLLSDKSLSGEKDALGGDITISQKAQISLKGFLTQREKNFLNV